MSSQAHIHTSRQRRRRLRRYEEIPTRLHRATEFTDDPQLCDALVVIALLQRFPDIVDDLVAETTRSMRDGRRRMDGNWALIMLAFVLGRFAVLQRTSELAHLGAARV